MPFNGNARPPRGIVLADDPVTACEPDSGELRPDDARFPEFGSAGLRSPRSARAVRAARTQALRLGTLVCIHSERGKVIYRIGFAAPCFRCLSGTRLLTYWRLMSSGASEPRNP
jgi:hypothetical protein